MRRVAIFVWLILALIPDAALAGHQPNPLPVFARDNTRHELLFTHEGIRYDNRLFERASRFVYVADGSCETRELKLLRSGKVLLTHTRYTGCKRGRKRLLGRVQRTFAREKFQTPCERITQSFTRKDKTLSMANNCDGTATLGFGGYELILTQTRANRFRGRGANGSIRWLRWKPGGSKLSLSGRIGRSRLKGAWRIP